MVGENTRGRDRDFGDQTGAPNQVMTVIERRKSGSWTSEYIRSASPFQPLSADRSLDAR